MTSHSVPEFALDPIMVAEIEAGGLSVRRIDGSNRAGTDAWVEAVARGFLDAERNEAQRAASFERMQGCRALGVYDPHVPLPEQPVATFKAWESELSLPGSAITTYAISAVTVAPTHRRRGLLRSMMSGELRGAARAGYPIASLTVSEAGIYGRFGFAPAAYASVVELKARRAGWIGPQPGGRVDFISRVQARAVAPELHGRVRPGRPGEVNLTDGDWDQLFGTTDAAEKADQLRVIQYRSAAGQLDGLAVYSVTENLQDYADSTVNLIRLIAVTDDAYAGMWRFLLDMDLIGTIKAEGLSIDEPLWWMIADRRAANVSVRDHHYLRILDVAAVLESRRYFVADSVVLVVSDPLGIAEGSYRLTVDADGAGSVTPVAEASAGEPAVRLGVAELSAILLGGVSPVTLAQAGRLRGEDPARLGRLFVGSTVPLLSFWY